MKVKPIKTDCFRLEFCEYEFGDVVAYLKRTSVIYSNHEEYGYLVSIFENYSQKYQDKVIVTLSLQEFNVFVRMLLMMVPRKK